MKEFLTNVPAEESIREIEELLIGFNVKNITKEYEQNSLRAITFTLTVEDRDVPFRLPINIESIKDRLKMEVRKVKPSNEYWIRLHNEAERIGWALMVDFIDLQISLVKLGQTQLMETLLPFVWDWQSQETLYTKMKTDGFKMLPQITQG